MPRLPDKDALGPAPSLYTPERIITGQQYGAGLVGQGLARAGQTVEGVGDEMQRQTDALQLVNADKSHRADLLNMRGQLLSDPDYATYEQRYDQLANDSMSRAASGITNPRVRQEWLARADYENEQQRLHVRQQADLLGRQDTHNQIEDNLRVNQDAYVAATSDEERAARLRDMHATLDVAQHTRYPLRPHETYALKDRYINGALERDADTRIANGDARGVLDDLTGKTLRAPNAPPTQPFPIQTIPGRPLGLGSRTEPIQGIVIHHTSGSSLDGALEEGRKSRTGANYYIDRDGTVYMGAPEDQYTAHIQPPNSKFRNGNNPNLSSGNTIGIEVVAKNDADVTPEERDSIQRLTADAAKRNGVKPENVVGHGEIQGGPGGNKEADEGTAAAKAYRDSAAGQGLYPGSRYATLRPDRIRALTYKASTALRAQSQDDVKQDVANMGRGIDPQPDANGKTSLDRLKDNLATPNEVAKAQILWRDGLAQKNATYGTPNPKNPEDALPLSELKPDQAQIRISKLSDPIQRKVARDWDNISKLRQSDPAQLVEGMVTKGVASPLPQWTVGEDGQGHWETPEDSDLRIHTHPMVWNAIQTSNLRKSDDAVTALEKRIDARLAAQTAIGISPYDQRTITHKEAEWLFNTNDPGKITSDAEFAKMIAEAKERASQHYGRYASKALEDAAAMLIKRSNQRDQVADIGAGIITGRLNPFAWGTAAGRLPPSQWAPAPQPATPPSAAPRIRPGIGPVRSSDAGEQPATPEAPPGPRPPSQGEINWLQTAHGAEKDPGEQRRIRRAFDKRMNDRGAAERELRNAGAFFNQQDRGRF